MEARVAAMVQALQVQALQAQALLVRVLQVWVRVAAIPPVREIPQRMDPIIQVKVRRQARLNPQTTQIRKVIRSKYAFTKKT
jgi:hypothetical protein